MSLALQNVTDAELRSICKERIEALEHWLRRLNQRGQLRI